MCGRFVRMASAQDIVDAFGASGNSVSVPPSYNVAPSHPILALREERAGREAFVPTWGFQARWKGSSSLVINARIEGVHERPLFRNLVTTHRCVIPLSGYYEWVSNADTLRILGHPSKKVPYYITSSSTESGSAITLSAAGLWRSEGDMAFAVMLTTTAVQSIATVHDRMPVLLFEEQIDSWLSSSAAVDWEALARQETCDLVATRVGNSVNSTRNDSSDLLIPYRGDEQERLF